MKKLFFRCNSPCFTHLFLFFTGKKNIQRSKWGRPQDPVAGRGPNDGTFWGRPQDVGYACFLNSTHKHIKCTLTSYSRHNSEL